MPAAPPDVLALFSRSWWIWPESPHWDIHNSYALFRHRFELKRMPARAPLFLTADQSYRLFVNGRFAGRGPARGFQASWPYDEIDLRPFLRAGRNTLAVRAYNPGYSNFQYLSQGYAGFLAAAKWGQVEIHTSAAWKSLRQASVDGDTVPTSLQLFSQEHIDLREDPADWAAPDFDDSGWIAPVENLWNGGPWFGLEPRGIPLLAERRMAPAALIGDSEGTSAERSVRTRDVIALRFREDRSHRPTDAAFDPLVVPATGAGKFRSYLFDFGRTVVGNLTFTVEGARGGEIVDTCHVETIDRATLTPDLVLPVHCRTAFGDRLVARTGAFTHHFYHFYGFRFLEVTVRDTISELRLKLDLNWVGYPLERKGSFHSSDAELVKLWETCAWTQQCCSLDAYVDTPWREQAQWWGDARVQGWNTFYLSGETRLFRRGLRQIASQATPDGVTYGHAPTMAHGCILPDFTLIWMLTVWDYYWQTESLEPFLAHAATLENALAYFRRWTDPRTGLLTYDKRFWLFLDWIDLPKEGSSTVYNLWLLLALEKMALLHRRARQPRAAAGLEAWTRKLRTALGRLLDRDGLLRDGYDARGRVIASTSIHAQTLALMAGLKGLNAERVMTRLLVPFIRREERPKITPSAYWITYVFTVLIERGFEREVIGHIKERWRPMLAHGTTWENFQLDGGASSASHAWSAHPLFHLMNTVGGVRQTAAGWKEILFQPFFHGTEAATVVPSPRGPIRAAWKKNGSKIDVSLQLPAGVRAKVVLPGLTARGVTGRKKWSIAA